MMLTPPKMLAAAAALAFCAACGTDPAPRVHAPRLPASTATPPTAPLPPPPPAVAPPQPASPPAPAPAPKPVRFLIIGDSQTQKSFGWTLDYLLRVGVPEAQVATYGVCASTALSWVSGTTHRCGGLVRLEGFAPPPLADADFKRNGGVSGRPRTPKLLDLLHAHKPDVVVIALGENFKGASSANVTETTRLLARRVACYRAGITSDRDCARALAQHAGAPPAPAGAPSPACLWILPPYTRIAKPVAWLDRFYRDIQTGVAPTCQTLDSRAMTCSEGHADPDIICDTDASRRLYFNRTRARLWGLGAAQAVLDALDLAPLPAPLVARVSRAWALDSDDAKGAHGVSPIPSVFRGVHRASVWRKPKASAAPLLK